MITRASMYSSDGRAFDIRARGLLGDLCFLDERDQDLEPVYEVVRGYGKLGVDGPFAALFGKDGSYVGEVASVFAEQFCRLGYLQVDRLLDRDEWYLFTTGLRELIEGRDVRRGEVEARFGPPSIVADGRVLCYAPADGSGWVFVDCYTEHITRYVAGAGNREVLRDDDPLVRSVRHPAPDFESGLILTLYGNALRWGPGWWLEQPESLNGDHRKVASHARAEPADPPPAFKPTRGHARR